MRNDYDAVALSLDDCLANAAEAYRRANNFMPFDNSCDMNSVAENIRTIPNAKKRAWAKLWDDVTQSLNAIELPAAYFDVLDKVHYATVFAIPAFDGNVFEKQIGFMQDVADHQAETWKALYPKIFEDFKGTRVVPFHWDATQGAHQDEFSLWPSEKTGEYYYRVSDRNEVLRVDIAAHEPQHSVQLYLVDKSLRGDVLPEPLHTAARIFSLYRQEGVGNWPPSLFGQKGDSLFDAVLNVYLNSPTEIAAFYQGNKLEAHFAPVSRDFKNFGEPALVP